MPRPAAKWWNAQRGDKEHIIALLCGWYWSYRGQEAGPFHTISAAQRDFYYRQLTRQRPPLMDDKEYEQARIETTKPVARQHKARNGYANARA